MCPSSDFCLSTDDGIPSRPHTAFLGLGSNLNDGASRVEEAVGRIAEEGVRIIGQASVYRTPPLGEKGDCYYNSVVAVECGQPYESLNTLLKEIEGRMGRGEDSRRCGRVEIDIDIVIFDGVIRRSADFGRYYFRSGYDELLRRLPSSFPVPSDSGL